MKVRAHIIINGRVQGVFFRSRTKQEANSRDVKGWVRNLLDGRVEAVFEGEAAAVKSMIEFCRNGPIGAVVTKIDVVWENYVGDFGVFSVRY